MRELWRTDGLAIVPGARADLLVREGCEVRRENLGACTGGVCHNKAVYLWSQMCRSCHKAAHGKVRHRDRGEEILSQIGSGNYADTGCDVSASCLRCPLPLCKYELTAYELDMVQGRMAV